MKHASKSTAERIHLVILIILELIMAIELVLLVTQSIWLNAILVATIMLITLAPAVLQSRMPVQIPAEFQLLAVVFVFSALFLGEVRSYYERIWWWDIALHVSSGLLLGLVGFLLIYVLNENARVDVHMRPRFVALFAFLFAVSVGAVWEIFEFAMDQIAGTTMQKPMFGDSSGLTDTMWDLIVDTAGAFLISALGWWFMKRKTRSPAHATSASPPSCQGALVFRATGSGDRTGRRTAVGRAEVSGSEPFVTTSRCGPGPLTCGTACRPLRPQR
jgi:hypothetical protein